MEHVEKAGIPLGRLRVARCRPYSLGDDQIERIQAQTPRRLAPRSWG